MASSLNGTGVTFSDGTTQASARVGARGQVFTSSGTFTVPAGITSVRVQLIGGGGGGGQYNLNASTAGGTSSFGAYCSATGGGAGRFASGGAGGTGSGGSINYAGSTGAQAGGCAPDGGWGGMGFATATNTAFSNPNGSANIANLFTGGYAVVGTGVSANSYGNGGAAYDGARGGGGGGGCIAFVTGLTPGGTVSVTVGTGGTRAGNPAGFGYQGLVLVEW